MSKYPLFSVMGIEIEYMLVDKHTLDVCPISDKLIFELAGEQVNEVARDNIAISNELVMHVLELKNNGPKPGNLTIIDDFQQAILTLQPLLDRHGVLLLPSGAHPWMNPDKETKRWPYGNQEIYRQYDKIFNCKGHGWSNLQSMHVNLPFANEDEFVCLHSAIRLLLPMLPALSASTPFLNGKRTQWVDTRLYFYNRNQQKIPSITGMVIPEAIQGYNDYEQTIFNPMYDDIKPHDPKGILQHAWLNSRGAIAKFEVGAVEIRILDSQECVVADISIALLIQALLKSLIRQSDDYRINPCDAQQLKSLYDKVIKQGLEETIDERAILAQWQLPIRTMKLYDFWAHLIERCSSDLPLPVQMHLEVILSQGNLSNRLVKACGSSPDKKRLHAVYRQLAECLLHNQRFSG